MHSTVSNSDKWARALDQRRNRFSEILGARFASKICRAWPFTQYMLDRPQDCVVRFTLSKEIQHQSGRPDHRDRIGYALAVDVWSGAVHRFEKRGKASLGIQVG